MATHSDEQVPSGVSGAGSGFKHVPPDLNDPADAAVVGALVRRCDLCGAPPGELCVKRHGIRNDLAGRLIHIGRMQPPHPQRRVR